MDYVCGDQCAALLTVNQPEVLNDNTCWTKKLPSILTTVLTGNKVNPHRNNES